MECRGVVIAFFISSSHLRRLCRSYPLFELEMWRRAAVTAIKICSVNDFYNLRYEPTRNIRKAMQVGKVSTPQYRATRNIESHTVVLEGPHDHLFYIRPQSGMKGSASLRSMSRRDPASQSSGGRRKTKGVHELNRLRSAEEIVSRRRILSGPLKVKVGGEDVTIQFRLKPTVQTERRNESERRAKAKMRQAMTESEDNTGVKKRASMDNAAAYPDRTGISPGVLAEAAPLSQSQPNVELGGNSGSLVLSAGSVTVTVDGGGQKISRSTFRSMRSVV